MKIITRVIIVKTIGRNKYIKIEEEESEIVTLLILSSSVYPFSIKEEMLANKDEKKAIKIVKIVTSLVIDNFKKSFFNDLIIVLVLFMNI